jgi:hypothetical protein
VNLGEPDDRRGLLSEPRKEGNLIESAVADAVRRPLLIQQPG